MVSRFVLTSLVTVLALAHSMAVFANEVSATTPVLSPLPEQNARHPAKADEVGVPVSKDKMGGPITLREVVVKAAKSSLPVRLPANSAGLDKMAIAQKST